MKFFTLLLTCTLFIFQSNAQTSFSGGIYNSTAWTQAGSPYTITDNVVIFSSAVLTIEPGVEIKMASGKYIEVRGGIIAHGTAQLPISIHGNTATNTPNFWEALVLRPSSGSYELSWVTISDARYALDMSYALTGPYTVKNCTFTYNGAGNQSGGYGVTFDHCLFSHNNTGLGYFQFGGTVSNCTFDANIDGVNGSEKVVNCLFTNNTGVALAPYGQTSNCIVRSNNIGVRCLFNSVNNKFVNNSVTNNRIGLDVQSYFNGSIDLYGNTFCNNTDYNVVLNTGNDCNIPNNCWCPESTSNPYGLLDGHTDITRGLITVTPVSTSCNGTTGVSTTSLKNGSFRIYPNPVNAGDDIYVKPDGFNPTDAEIRITDLAGRIVEPASVATSGKDVRITFAGKLSPGVYYLSVQCPGVNARSTKPFYIVAE